MCLPLKIQDAHLIFPNPSLANYNTHTTHTHTHTPEPGNEAFHVFTWQGKTCLVFFGLPFASSGHTNHGYHGWGERTLLSSKPRNSEDFVHQAWTGGTESEFWSTTSMLCRYCMPVSWSVWVWCGRAIWWRWDQELGRVIKRLRTKTVGCVCVFNVFVHLLLWWACNEESMRVCCKARSFSPSSWLETYDFSHTENQMLVIASVHLGRIGIGKHWTFVTTCRMFSHYLLTCETVTKQNYIVGRILNADQAISNKCNASSNKCLTSSNKKLFSFFWILSANIDCHKPGTWVESRSNGATRSPATGSLGVS